MGATRRVLASPAARRLGDSKRRINGRAEGRGRRGVGGSRDRHEINLALREIAISRGGGANRRGELLLFFYTWHARRCLYARVHGWERRQCRLQSHSVSRCCAVPVLLPLPHILLHRARSRAISRDLPPGAVPRARRASLVHALNARGHAHRRRARARREVRSIAEISRCDVSPG